MRMLTKPKEINSFIDRLSKRAEGEGPETAKTVRKILADVRKNGDRAVLKYTAKFDGHTMKSLRLSTDEIKRHADRAGKDVVSALRLSARRIRIFHELQREKSWTVSEKGIKLGQIIRPLNRVGVYVPGGKASYPSTVLMNVIPAQVAGVKEIAVAVPTPGGEVNPYVMAALDMLKVQEVYAIGGAQAVGALAYGTDTIKRVDKIVGPGNIFVAVAKKLVFGTVDIDMIAGPSEILIIADSSGTPDFIAADILSQAEHDELASSILITDSEDTAKAVSLSVARQLKTLKRRDRAQKALQAYGAIMIVDSIDEAVRISNIIAPEHLEIMTKKPSETLKLIENAGAIFMGKWSTEPLGDYSAGPNHTLPTGGTARFSSPLGVYDFMKRTSLLEFTKEGFLSLADTVEKIADTEGLEGHANAVRVRRSALINNEVK